MYYRGVILLVFAMSAIAFVAANSDLVSAEFQSDYYQIGDYYTPCQLVGNDNTIQCSGYLYQDPSGCIELAAAVSSYSGLLSYQYYTLHNLPSSYTIGAWATVTGQLYQGYNYAPNGAACPGNYINVTSISQ